MGMFDDISLFMQCPKCKVSSMFALQTKDLECNLNHYRPLPADWFTNQDTTLGKKFREQLPVFPSFPFDKAASVWESQAEKTEAQAMPSKEYGEQLKYIIVYGHCSECEAPILGKIMIEQGMLIGSLLCEE